MEGEKRTGFHLSEHEKHLSSRASKWIQTKNRTQQKKNNQRRIGAHLFQSSKHCTMDPTNGQHGKLIVVTAEMKNTTIYSIHFCIDQPIPHTIPSSKEVHICYFAYSYYNFFFSCGFVSFLISAVRLASKRMQLWISLRKLS